jgi:tetratricopeptide (TPR) repeat protein
VSSTSAEDHLLVNDVVNTLTCPPDRCEDRPRSLKEQLELAAEEYDSRAAESIGRALVDSLCEDPSNVRKLEALLILGLAHPHILEQHQVSLGAEGRRLCVLLENNGESERARGLLELLCCELPEDRQIQQDLSSSMRRSGEIDELVERCLARAEVEVEQGRLPEAIAWLQEVLLHDQSRRDVARMIRDLRYQEMANQKAAKRRNRIVLLLVVFTTTLTALGLREHKIRQEYAALPQAPSNDTEAMETRIRGIDSLISSNHFWFGMFSVVDERSALRNQRERLGARLAAEKRVENEQLYMQEARAESIRLKGIDAVSAGELTKAKGLFGDALKSAPQDWDRRERVEANIVAIERLLRERE